MLEFIGTVFVSWVLLGFTWVGGVIFSLARIQDDKSVRAIGAFMFTSGLASFLTFLYFVTNSQ